ncbi:hypothetical protein R1sor_004071 [Riccia sorocarpa]|uniref:Uncharacterized protein n=1 Tax=Riccia sorocarpa TaxID=122646 RepID=A0ABD3H7C5_9MARC
MGSQRTRGRKYDRPRTDQREQHSSALELLAEERRRRARERMVKRSVDFIHDLSARNEELESRIVAGVVSHHELESARRLASVYSDKELRCAKMLLDNMTEGLRTVKGTHSQDDVIAKKCALRMLSSNNIVQHRLASASGRILNLAPRNFRIHALGRADVLDDENMQVGKWAGVKPGRKQRSDRLLPELKELVVK